MKRKPITRMLVIGGRVALTAAAMAYARHRTGGPAGPGTVVSGEAGILTLSGQLTQEKVLQGSDGIAGLSLLLRAGEVPDVGDRGPRSVDMVIVLDRSGSMEGEKIDHARQAVLHLLSSLTGEDRFALVTYADDVRVEAAPAEVTADARQRLEAVVRRVEAGGGTNLGGGLRAGMELLRTADRAGRLGRVVLISDGLANQGVTDPQALAEMAAGALAGEFAVSTVGVGYDFNEELMTSLADRGTGNYYYLENPATFAAVFQKEFQSTRVVAAGGVEIRVPLADGITLVDAGGYPVEAAPGEAVFRPGDVLSGQTRKLVLSLRVPTDREAAFALEGITARYLHDGRERAATLPTPFRLACVKKPQEVWASIDAGAWEGKVLNEDYNKLKEEVARDLRSGDRDGALERIRTYHDTLQAVNAQVQSPAVAENLEKDLGALRETVDETFTGSAQEVETKQKQNAKSMQFEGYLGRRGKK